VGFKFIIIFAIFTAVLIYGFVNWKNNGTLFGFSPYKNVDLAYLLSFANFYSGKKICTKGYYIQTSNLFLLKVSLEENEFERSVWINNQSDKDIVLTTPQVPEKGTIATLCGLFESQRAGEFGEPPLWNHQLTVENFRTFGEELPVDTSNLPFK